MRVFSFNRKKHVCSETRLSVGNLVLEKQATVADFGLVVELVTRIMLNFDQIPFEGVVDNLEKSKLSYFSLRKWVVHMMPHFFKQILELFHSEIFYHIRSGSSWLKLALFALRKMSYPLKKVANY